jgi:hypothetical protein
MSNIRAKVCREQVRGGGADGTASIANETGRYAIGGSRWLARCGAQPARSISSMKRIARNAFHP